MKTLDMKHRQIGYLIKQTERESWIKLQPSNYVRSKPHYIHPEDYYTGAESIRLGWWDLADCKQVFNTYIQELKTNYPEKLKQYNFTIVKVIVTEKTI